MISKIIEMSKLTEKLDILNQNLENNFKKIESIQTNIENLKINLDELTNKVNNHDKSVSTLSKNHESTVKVVEVNNQRYSKILNDFSIMQSNLNEKIFDKINIELKPYFTKLKTDIRQFDDINNQIAILTSSLNQTNKGFNHYKKISDHISKLDFSLIEYKKNLDKEDRNKLSLMKQVSDLKSMIAKERMKKRFR